MVSRTIVGPDVPGWAKRVLPEMDRARYDRPSRPVPLKAFVNTAGLPDPTKFSGCMCFNTALGVPVISDGTFWYPVSVGAHL